MKVTLKTLELGPKELVGVFWVEKAGEESIAGRRNSIYTSMQFWERANNLGWAEFIKRML